MAITIDDFAKVWASQSPLTPYSFSESQYKEGWNFIGSTPPSRQMWDYLQKNNDEKMQYLANNYLPLNGGTLTGNNAKITMSNGESYVRGWGNGLYLGGTDGNNNSNAVFFTNTNGTGFRLNAGDGTTQKTMVGKPDGTLTWNGQPLLPVGIVQAFAGTTIPNGWLLCDGSAVSRTDYAALFAVIGTTYGAGNGSTTFNLPNLTDKFVEGSATAGTVKSAGLPNITGMLQLRNGDNVGFELGDDNNGAFSAADSTRVTSYVESYDYGQALFAPRLKFSAHDSSSIYGNSATVQPPALTMRYIIKY